MPYVQRRDGVVCGCYAQRQPGLAEELLAEDHPDVLVYLNPPPDPRLVLDQEERLQAKLDAAVMALVNVTPAQLVTYARNNFPTLTLAEQNRMGTILFALAVAARPRVRA